MIIHKVICYNNFCFLLGPGISPLTIQQFSWLGTLQIYLSFTYLVSEWLEHGIPKAVHVWKTKQNIWIKLFQLEDFSPLRFDGEIGKEGSDWSQD
jgi:hypothetical protein